jgi:hypothetical protein
LWPGRGLRCGIYAGTLRYLIHILSYPNMWDFELHTCAPAGV